MNLRRHEQVVTPNRGEVRFLDVEPGLFQIDGRVRVTAKLRVHTTDGVQSISELRMLVAFPFDLKRRAVISERLLQISGPLIDPAEDEERERLHRRVVGRLRDGESLLQKFSRLPNAAKLCIDHRQIRARSGDAAIVLGGPAKAQRLLKLRDGGFVVGQISMCDTQNRVDHA